MHGPEAPWRRCRKARLEVLVVDFELSLGSTACSHDATGLHEFNEVTTNFSGVEG